MFLPQKKKKKGKVALLALIVLILVSWFCYSYNLNTPVFTTQSGSQFVVEPGWGSRKISQELKKAGLIRSQLVFQIYVWQKGISSRLLDGEYYFVGELNTKDIAQILARGAGATKEITLTFIEGWHNQEMADYLKKRGIAEINDFMAIIQKKADWWDQYNFLNSKPRNLDLEGYLFPDTYRIYSDASIKDVVQKMLDNFDKKLTPELRVEIAKQDKTIHEILTLASILEKEVSTEKDRKLVADIFYKRLEAKMALQADSTVNYVTGKGVTRSSAEDLQVDSPYNTYKYRGLPPGPICHPGLSAIQAAVYPIKNDYWYFLTTPRGEVIYSQTHDEHVSAKSKYYR